MFEDLPRDRTMRWIEAAGVSVYRAPSSYANGQTRDRQGRLISCSHRDRCLFRTELDGSVTRLVDRHDGRRLNAPNDVTVKSDGTIWFTDPLYGIQTTTKAAGSSRSSRRRSIASIPDWRRSASRPAISTVPTASPSRPTSAGCTSPRQAIRPPTTRSSSSACSTSERTESCRGGEIFQKIEPGYSDGMTVDEDGNVWSSAADGVHCISPAGDLLGKVLVPYRVSNLTFGGHRRNRLFIGGSQTLYAIFLNRRGVRWP